MGTKEEGNDRACLAWANQMETTEAGRQAGKYDPGAERQM